MTKSQLRRSFENSHGIGIAYGYSHDGFCGSWPIYKPSDIDGLPNGIAYEWKK